MAAVRTAQAPPSSITLQVLAGLDTREVLATASARPRAQSDTMEPGYGRWPLPQSHTRQYTASPCYVPVTAQGS
ncbi:hypothetical protein GGTG_13403 [Gaeumannomyces tritici R3-111a-1]|uniref:Uncharacterized protein n=1 Tax=Gaeumannomyces tritici (strain R3-111a-1) TaxID=644352 RepID=J3PIS4_GAET3|nr:hypothetical protein GGTG_13403 [Gaeumannomyces tritici R3-111a-1]EJT69006.1 hypothetical protein GGTG_13403 [Gaeumannomyces tritici R3-111a-1]